MLKNKFRSHAVFKDVINKQDIGVFHWQKVKLFKWLWNLCAFFFFSIPSTEMLNGWQRFRETLKKPLQYSALLNTEVLISKEEHREVLSQGTAPGKNKIISSEW